MPEPPANRFGEADALFDAALDLPAADQDAFIDRLCAGDPELAREVRRLLAAYRQTSGFLEAPAVELARPLLDRDRPAHAASARLKAPREVGPFRVVRELGQGRAGVVYLAERDDASAERVALRLLTRTDSDAFLARFVEHQRALARLEHPGIARVVDGGVTPDGTPWLATEYVEGEPLDRYCDARALPIARRLELFDAVCDAVAYTHRRTIVHGGLEPGSILVVAGGRPKLLDFGVAEHAGPPASPRAREYAAPEQLRGEPATVTTDVYALGVLLHTLLTGRRRQDDRGPAPSDLEAIVLKAMRGEPSRRYPTVAALREDMRLQLPRRRGEAGER